MRHNIRGFRREIGWANRIALNPRGGALQGDGTGGKSFNDLFGFSDRFSFSLNSADHRTREGNLKVEAYCERPERLRPWGFLAASKPG
jgi:hypothetical protein